MRVIILALLLSCSSFTAAQGMPEGMQEAMECMSSLDQDVLRGFGGRAEEIANEIKALCKTGDESGAMDVAMNYAQELAGNQEVIKLKECSEVMRKAMPSMQIPEIPSAEEYEDHMGSICENLD